MEMGPQAATWAAVVGGMEMGPQAAIWAGVVGRMQTRPGNLRRLILIILVGGLVHVVVIRDQARHQHQQQQAHFHQKDSCARPPQTARQARSHRHHQRCACKRNRDFPGPEHKLDVILAAGMAPEGDQHLDSDQILDSQQDSKQTWAHEKR